MEFSLLDAADVLARWQTEQTTVLVVMEKSGSLNEECIIEEVLSSPGQISFVIWFLTRGFRNQFVLGADTRFLRLADSSSVPEHLRAKWTSFPRMLRPGRPKGEGRPTFSRQLEPR